MEALRSSFVPVPPIHARTPSSSSPKSRNSLIISSTVRPDPWSTREGDPNKPKPKSKNPKNPLSDDNARRIIKGKAKYLSTLRRNQGSLAQTPKWIKRTPEQMAQYLEDERHGHLYGRHVVAAIRRVRSLSQKAEGSYNMREVMSSFVTKLSFRDMCTVLKEQRGWMQVRDFFSWMKLQLGYRPSIIAYTIVLRMYGQVGKIKLAEHTFLEMLEAGIEADEVACGTMLCAYARWGRHKSMLSFYSAVQQRQLTPSVSVYNFMLSSLHKKSLHKNVIDLYRQMVDTQVNPITFTYTLLIDSFVHENLVDEAFHTLKEMRSSGFVPQEITYSSLISLSSKMGNQDIALELYQEMRSYKIIPSHFTCASLLALYYKRGDYTKAVSLFSDMEKYKIVPDEVIYSLLIRIYGKLGLYEDAQRTFNEIRKLGLLKNEKTYTTMAQVHLNAGNDEKALDVMEQMRSTDIRLTRFAVKDMLGLYMKLGLDEKAKDFVIQIRKDGVKFDEELYKKVIEVYCKEGMVTEAEELLREMSNIGLIKGEKSLQSGKASFYKSIFDAKSSKPEEAYLFYKEETEKGKNNDMGAVAISILVNNLATFGKFKEAENVIRDCFRDKLKLDTVAYNTFIKSMRKAGKLEFAASIYERMISSGVAPSIRTFHTMISVYGLRQNLSKAVGMFSDAQSMGVTLDEKAYTSMIRLCANAGKSHDAAYLYSKMREEGIKPELVTYNILMNIYGVRGMYGEAEKLIKDMERDECMPDSIAYLSLVRAYTVGHKYTEAEETIDSVWEKGKILKESCSRHYNLLISALGKAGLVGEAERVYKKLIEVGISPSHEFKKIMMKIYVENGHIEQGISFFESNYNEETETDEFIMSWAVHLYRSAGVLSRAGAVLCSMHNLGIPFVK